MVFCKRDLPVLCGSVGQFISPGNMDRVVYLPERKGNIVLKIELITCLII